MYRRVSLASSYGYQWPPLSPDDSSSPVGSVDTTSYFISTMAIPALPSKTFSVSFPNSKKVLWLVFLHARSHIVRKQSMQNILEWFFTFSVTYTRRKWKWRHWAMPAHDGTCYMSAYAAVISMLWPHLAMMS